VEYVGELTLALALQRLAWVLVLECRLELELVLEWGLELVLVLE
jgi:hypothetical protein